MNNPRNCEHLNLVTEEETGNLVCSSCYLVQEYNNYEAHIGGLTGPTGTNVRVGTSGSGSVYNYHETKRYKAQKLIQEIMFKLGFPGSRSDEVKFMVERITDGEYGQGNWFPIFVGACAYVVTRKDGIMLPIVEISDVIGCDVHELGRMINRVVDYLKLKLPQFDIVSSFERVIKSSPSFSGLGEDKLGRMLKQGVFLLQCLIKWFVTTGRRPLPVVVAVLVFVAELNQVEVKIEDMAIELHVVVATCKLRYKELLERLVEVARVLPWGKDITVKNIMKNAPFIMQYMELKSMAKCGPKDKSSERFDLNFKNLMVDCLNKGYNFDNYGTVSDFQYFELNHSPNWSSDDLAKLNISYDCLSEIQSKFLIEVAESKSKTAESRVVNGRKRRRDSNYLQACTDWWKGKSELSKKLLLKQILEKEVGLNPMPPSFENGCLVYQRRRKKMEAAKIRIGKIMDPSNAAVSGDSTDVCLSEYVNLGKKRRRKQVDFDWEDLIIETLLLHQVEEKEIEKGHYNTLLDLHVFNSGML